MGLLKTEVPLPNYPKSHLLGAKPPQMRPCIAVASRRWLGNGGVRRKKVEVEEEEERLGEGRRDRHILHSTRGSST